MENAQLPQRDPPVAPGTATGLLFRLHAARRDLTNFSFRRHGAFDRYIVTMHQSGSHWLKYLLTLILTRAHGLPEPRHIEESLVIGGPKDPPRYKVSPRIGMSHTIPSPVIASAWLRRRYRLPRYAILVRDPRSTLASHYQKHGTDYGVEFSEYLRGDPSGKRFDKDIWWDVRFMNTWGTFARRHPDTTHIIRYEDLTSNPGEQVARLLDFLGIELEAPESLITWAINNSSKEKMARLENPDADKPSVQIRPVPRTLLYSPKDREFVTATLGRFLKHDFGYDFSDWHHIPTVDASRRPHQEP